MRGPQVQPGPRSATLDQRAVAVERPETSWAASLVQPFEARVDSEQAVVVDVVGPVGRLSGPVRIGLLPRAGGPVAWLDASWQDAVDNRGTAVAILSGRTRPGRYDVVVRPDVGGQRPVLTAGRVAVH